MAKKTETVPFTPVELTEMKRLCSGAAKSDVTGMAYWRGIAVLLHPYSVAVSKDRDSGRFAESSKIFQDDYAEKAKVNLSATLQAESAAKKTPFVEPTVTDEMVAGWKDYARKNFSRMVGRAEVVLGYREPPAPPVRPPQVPGTPPANPPEPGQDGPGSTLVKPSVVDAIGKLATRCASIQAELVQFQQHVRVPKNGLALIGDMAEQLAKMHTEIADIQALLL